MSMIGSVAACPHCGAGDQSGGQSQFCAACGKALPSAASAGPRIVSGSAFASTTAGQKLQADELRKTARKARGALLAVAIIQTIVCVGLAVLANSFHRLDFFLHSAVFIALAAVGTIFWCLWGWAMRQPLPAAIVGLVIYVTLVAINVITAMNAMAKGGAGNGGFGGLGIGWLDIVIMAVLTQAISAGVKHRKMMAQGIA